MINPQLFFVKGTIGDLKRVAKKYPAVRRLYARNDDVRGKSIIAVYVDICGWPQMSRKADSVWNTALRTQDFHEVTYLAAHMLSGRGARVEYIPRGGVLPRVGLGFAFCPAMPVHTPAVLLDDMRVMKWCSATCVPTFGLAKTLADTVLVHAEA